MEYVFKTLEDVLKVFFAVHLYPHPGFKIVKQYFMDLLCQSLFLLSITSSSFLHPGQRFQLSVNALLILYRPTSNLEASFIACYRENQSNICHEDCISTTLL